MLSNLPGCTEVNKLGHFLKKTKQKANPNISLKHEGDISVKVSTIFKEIPELTVLTSAGSVSSQNKVAVGSDIVIMTHVLRFNFSAVFIRALFTQTQMLFDQFDICFVKLIMSLYQILGRRCLSVSQ